MIADSFNTSAADVPSKALDRGPITIQELADALATEIHGELALRDITAESSGERVKAHRHSVNGVLLIEPGELFQISAFAEFSSLARRLRRASDLVAPWARELAIKLARPYPLTTYPLELPAGVEEAALGQCCGVQVRVVTQYVMQTDQMLYRFDLLCKWDEQAVARRR
jgi:hypothetical protein